MTIQEFIQRHAVTRDEWPALRAVLIALRIERMQRELATERFYGGKSNAKRH